MSDDKDQKRVVYVNGNITEDKVVSFIKSMFKLEVEDPITDIVVIYRIKNISLIIDMF
jgi:ATP-dependent protease ClpP protease subunit